MVQIIINIVRMPVETKAGGLKKKVNMKRFNVCRSNNYTDGNIGFI
jgi:hypothetical protein